MKTTPRVMCRPISMATVNRMTSEPTPSGAVAEQPASADHGPEAVDGRARVVTVADDPEAADDRAVEPAAEVRDPAPAARAEPERRKAAADDRPEVNDDGSIHLI
jgi:hypothetical protein